MNYLIMMFDLNSKVKIRKISKGSQIFKKTKGFLGILKLPMMGKGVSAELRPLSMEPHCFFVTIVFSNITARLNEINETQKEMFDELKRMTYYIEIMMLKE